MQLHNRINRDELKQKMMADTREYTTISFYKYHPIANPNLFRDHLYLALSQVECVGRIYIATEGINAQVSIPTTRFADFVNVLNNIDFLQNIRLNKAVEEKRTEKSFIKLDVKCRNKIVADGLDDSSFKPHNTGKYLKAQEWNQMLQDPNTVVIDMRNHYESEVGKFENATCPDVDTFKEELQIVLKEYAPQRNKNVLMYCTGGIRCEKASAWMKHNGFDNVYHLEGGIINYVKQVNEQQLENKFKGVNFVFDERLAERISPDVIAQCHQCGAPADTHINCANKGCHTLFIQCPACAKQYNHCCSSECADIITWPQEQQAQWRQNNRLGNNFTKGRLVKQRFLEKLK